MAKTIALNIKINSQGGEKVIKNINELESEIEKLSEELKGLDFGTKEYKETARALNTLKSEFKDVEKEFEGIDTEQKLSALAGAVEAVSGAFLIAGSAARTFGADAKSVEEIERLEQQALEAVNIALGVRQLLEGALQARILLRNSTEKIAIAQTKILTVAQTAYNAVVGTSTGLLRAFRLALAATGIGLFVIGLTELISRLNIFNKETEETNDTFDKLNQNLKDAETSTASFTVKTNALTKIIKDGNKPYGERVEAYKELQKLVPELAGYTLDEAVNTERLNQAIADQSRLVLLNARLKALEEILVEQEKIKIQEQLAQEAAEKAAQQLKENLELQQEYNRAVQGGFTGTLEEYKQTLENYKKLGRELAGLTDEVDDNTQATEENNTTQSLYQKTLDEQNEILARINGRTKENTDLKDKNKEKQDELNKALAEYARRIQAAANAFNKLTFEEEVQAKVLDDANKLIEEQNQLLEERFGILGTTAKEADTIGNQLRNLIGGVVIPEDEIKKATEFRDVYGDIVTGFIQAQATGTDFVVEIGGELVRVNEQLLNAGKATQLVQERVLKTIREQLGEEEFRNKVGEENYQTLLQFFDAQQDVFDLIENYNKELTEQDRLTKGIVSENLNLNQQILFYKQLLDEAGDSIALQENAYEKLQIELSTVLFSQTDITKLTDEQKSILDGISQTIQDQTQFYNDVLNVNKELEKLTGQIATNVDKQQEKLNDLQFDNLQKFILANKDSIDEIGKFFDTLSAETSNLTEEQLQAVKNLIKGVQDAEEWEGIKNKISIIAQEVSNLVGRFQQIAQAQISLELERLAAYEEQTLAIIGDETEAQREKQKEFQEEINKQRFELEKRARIQELQFAVATGIAGGAQAVINALALPIPPPGPQIIAGLYAGLTAVELATINSQLQFVKSTQYVPARRGGLVVGPDHESGGVMANGGLVLEGGEAVLNQNAVSQFGDLLSNISVATGGRALTVDDSRIVQEIRQQNQRPIKTYVLYEDIKDTNKINSKLEQISRL